MKILRIIVFVIFLAAVNGAGSAWAITSLPTLDYAGTANSVETAGNVVLTFSDNTTIDRVHYLNGEFVDVNNGEESIVDARLTVTGLAEGDCSTAAQDYLFFAGAGTMSITGPDNFVYMTADLSYLPPGSSVLFLFDGTRWLLYPPTLDAADPSLLNMSNINTYTDASHPSRYINELSAALEGSATDIAGMTMILTSLPGSGTLCDGSTGSSFNVQGVVDGAPDLPSNTPPVASAGENMNILTEDVSVTVLQGTVTDADADDALQCRWLWGENVLLDWVPAGQDGECPLDLGTLEIGIGTYTLTLEVTDGELTGSDELLLTIDNTAPNAAGTGGIFELGEDVVLKGDVSDYDGDELEYAWLEGDVLLCTGSLATIAGGTPVFLPDCHVSGMGLGEHLVVLRVNDGSNDEVYSNTVTVEVIDTTEPTIAPYASQFILWPPNHIMIDIVIEANAEDNSGMPVALSASVMSNEPVEGLGDGDMTPDWDNISIDQDTGTILLQLRRERSGTGEGRTYTVTINAEDGSGNNKSVDVEFVVPHDMKRKNK